MHWESTSVEIPDKFALRLLAWLMKSGGGGDDLDLNEPLDGKT